MKNQHTPGPWTTTVVERCGSIFIDTKVDGVPIAEICDLKSGGVSGTEANARLIASGPETLDALRDLVALCDERGLKQKWQTKVARAAIALATTK
jgi:hypothetical protein